MSAYSVNEAIRQYLLVVSALERAARDSSEEVSQLALERDGWTLRLLAAWSVSTDAKDRVEAGRVCPMVAGFAKLLREAKRDAAEAPKPRSRPAGIDVDAVRRRSVERAGHTIEHDPDAVANFIADCEALVADAGDVPEAGEDFADSVIEKTERMAAWAAEHGCFTQAQEAAISNMADAVARWRR